MTFQVIVQGDGWQVARWEDGTLTLRVPMEDGHSCPITVLPGGKVRVASEDDSIGFHELPLLALHQLVLLASLPVDHTMLVCPSLYMPEK